MANAYAVTYKKNYQDTTRYMGNALTKRELKVVQDIFEASSTADGTTIYFAKIPPNAALISGILSRDALGSGVTLAVGDGTTADRFLAATASNTANLNTALTIKTDDLGAPLSTSADTPIVVTLAGAAGTGTIKLLLTYIAA